MTRIVGQLWGADGPLNGRLFVKTEHQFIGAPTKELIFSVRDGIVDIELPACPRSMPYAVGWKSFGDGTRPFYAERWTVPPVDEAPLDKVRGMRPTANKQWAVQKADLVENNVLRNEVAELSNAMKFSEERNFQLVRKLTNAENLAFAAEAKAASLLAELQQARSEAAKAKAAMETITAAPETVERIVERTITTAEHQEELALQKEQTELLRIANEKLQHELDAALRLKTHFGALQSEIDRLKNEKQQLLSRIEELKQPVRTSSAFRNEAIANLDRLVND